MKYITERRFKNIMEELRLMQDEENQEMTLEEYEENGEECFKIWLDNKLRQYDLDDSGVEK